MEFGRSSSAAFSSPPPKVVDVLSDHSAPVDPRLIPVAAGDEQERLSNAELLEIRKQLDALGQSSTDLDELAEEYVTWRIGRFVIEGELGRGSFGTVYLAHDPKMSRKVAIKVAHHGSLSSEKLRKRFLSEAQAAARMAHPNVVTVHEYGEVDGVHYIVYQLCCGETLTEWLAEQPDRIEPRVAVEIASQLAQGLAHAHVRGIVHRDIKPSNVVLHRERDVSCPHGNLAIDFTPRLTDFGLAHDQLSRESGSLGDNLLGTIDYMSPEHVQGGDKSRSPTSDIYSLGVILYRMLAGVLPSPGNNVLEVLQHICSVEPISVSHHNPTIPEDLVAICHKCLEKNPANRYQACAALVADLTRWQSGAAITVRPRTTLERTWRAVAKAPVVYGLAMTVLLISITSAAVFFSLMLKLQQINHEQGELLAASKRSEARAVAANQQVAQANVELELKSRAIEREQLEKIKTDYRADLRLAYEDFQKGRLWSVARQLERIEGRREGYIDTCFAFDILKKISSNDRHQFETAIAQPRVFAIVPNSNLIVYGGANGQICFQNALTGNVEHSYSDAPTREATAIAVDPSGKRIAVGWSAIGFAGMKCSLVTTYQLNCDSSQAWLTTESDFFAASSTCESLSFSPNGRLLAIGQRYGAVVISDLESGKRLGIKTDGRNRSLDFSPDGTRLLILGRENSFRIAEVDSGELSLPILCNSTPIRALWTNDGKAIAFSEYNSERVSVIASTPPYNILHLASQELGVVETLATTPSGKHLVAGTRSGGLVIWDLAAAQAAGVVQLVPIHAMIPHGGTVLASETIDDQTIISLADSGELLKSLIPPTELLSQDTPPISLCDWNAMPDQFLAGFADGSVRKIDGQGRTLQVLKAGGESPVTAVALNSDGTHFAVGLQDGRVEVYNEVTLARQEAAYRIPEDSLQFRAIAAVQFSEDGKALTACGSDARVRVWQFKNLKQPALEHSFSSQAYCVCFVGSRYLACGGMFEEITVFDLESKRIVRQLPGTGLANTIMFDESRQTLVSGHADGHVRLHSSSSWKLEMSLASTVGGVRSLNLSPSAECYLVGTEHGQVNLLDADARSFIGTLKQFPDQRSIDAVEVSEDLQLLTLSRGVQGLHPVSRTIAVSK